MSAELKRPEPTFYHEWHPTDRFTPGEHIELMRTLEFSSWYVDKCDLAELIQLPLSDLESRRTASVEAEKAVFEKMQAAAQEWESRAVQTMLLDRALEYAHMIEVTHTANEWKQLDGGIWEISNRVYKMRYTVQEETDGKKKGQWCATWGIAINRPARPKTEKHYFSGDIMVVEQKKKYYNAERKPVITSRAVLTCMPTCLRSCPHPSRANISITLSSTVSFCQVIRWLPRSGRSRR